MARTETVIFCQLTSSMSHLRPEPVLANSSFLIRRIKRKRRGRPGFASSSSSSYSPAPSCSELSFKLALRVDSLSARALQRRERRLPPLHTKHLCAQLFLCLSRACLGKMIIFSTTVIKWLKKGAWFLFAPRSGSRCASRTLLCRGTAALPRQTASSHPSRRISRGILCSRHTQKHSKTRQRC